MKINEYIESGILEAYVLGSASDQEIEELLYLKKQYPKIQEALQDLEIDVERIAQYMAIPPPPGFLGKIEDRIDELSKIPKDEALTIKMPRGNNRGKKGKEGQFIEVEGPSSHMRVHKIWRWIIIAIFILGKIFLAFAIYFYFENRHTEQQLNELKTELKYYKHR